MLESVKNDKVKVGYQNEKSYLSEFMCEDTTYKTEQFLNSNYIDLMAQAYLNNNNSGIIQ